MIRAFIHSLLNISDPDSLPARPTTRLRLDSLEVRDTPTYLLSFADSTDASGNDGGDGGDYYAAGIFASNQSLIGRNSSGNSASSNTPTAPTRPPVVTPTPVRPPTAPAYNPMVSTRGTVVNYTEAKSASARVVVKTVRLPADATGNNLRLFADFLDRTGRVVRTDVAVGDHSRFGNQDQPSVAAMSNGNFAIAWRSSTPLTGTSTSIQYNIMNQTGAVVGSVERKANLIPSQRLANPQVTADNYGFHIQWTNSSTGRMDTRGFNTVGVPVG